MIRAADGLDARLVARAKGKHGRDRAPGRWRLDGDSVPTNRPWRWLCSPLSPGHLTGSSGTDILGISAGQGRTKDTPASEQIVGVPHCLDVAFLAREVLAVIARDAFPEVTTTGVDTLAQDVGCYR